MRRGKYSKASSPQPSCDEGQQPELTSQARIVSRNGLCRKGAIRLAIRETAIKLRSRFAHDRPGDLSITEASDLIDTLKHYLRIPAKAVACDFTLSASECWHSSITPTMDTYGHLFPGQEAEAVGRLESIMGPVHQKLAATGTEDMSSNERSAGRSSCDTDRHVDHTTPYGGDAEVTN